MPKRLSYIFLTYINIRRKEKQGRKEGKLAEDSHTRRLVTSDLRGREREWREVTFGSNDDALHCNEQAFRSASCCYKNNSSCFSPWMSSGGWSERRATQLYIMLGCCQGERKKPLGEINDHGHGACLCLTFFSPLLILLPRNNSWAAASSSFRLIIN